jgi:hypothetical protein
VGAAAVQSKSTTAAGGPEARAAIDLRKLAWLVAQLGLLLYLHWQFNVESSTFRILSASGVVSFLVVYFTPFAWKKPVFAVLSLLVGMVLLMMGGPRPGINVYTFIHAAPCMALVLLLGVLVYFCLRLPIAYWIRVLLLLLLGGVVLYARDRSGTAFLPDPHWAVVGAIFMFRTIVYAHDVRVARAPEKFVDFLCYFFLMPNFFFMLFPVIDYTTFKRSYFAVDIHKSAQRGIAWMVRGTIHLCLYRLIYHQQIAAEDVQSVGTLVRFVFSAYLLYLHVSGTFHFIVGMMHLFGWSLPETNRLYLLASGPTDFWRRINIYWKDFMVKCFYYPAYFRLRKVNGTVALLGATVWVFIATCLLHAYQWYWINGIFELLFVDVVWWTLLGAVVMVAVVREHRRGPPVAKPRGVAITQRVIATAGWYVFISVLWSMWSSRSIAEWLDTVIYWV